MATDSAAYAVHNTLSGTTADTVTITAPHDLVEVLNRGTVVLWFTIAPEGVAPVVAVAGADDTTVVPAGACVTVESPGKRGCALSVVGDGNPYSVQAVTG